MIVQPHQEGEHIRSGRGSGGVPGVYGRVVVGVSGPEEPRGSRGVTNDIRDKGHILLDETDLRRDLMSKDMSYETLTLSEIWFTPQTCPSGRPVPVTVSTPSDP